MYIANPLPAESSLDLSDNLYSATYATVKTSQQKIDTSLSGDNLSTDSVSFSSTSVPTSVERQARLLSIKEAIENGSYGIPASNVADAMLTNGF